MKRYALMMIVILWVYFTFAQPRPFEIDNTFQPTTAFMQKSWYGEYDGLETNSKFILSIKRTLVLYSDYTFINTVKAQVKNETKEFLLKYEKGAYNYSYTTQNITYTLEKDSVLDISNYLQSKASYYTINKYKQDGKEKIYTEKAQFTKANNDAARQLVLFDQQFVSPVDQSQKAVYVMTGKKIESTNIIPIYHNNEKKDTYYDINGRRVMKPGIGLYINKGKKVIIKR